MLVEFLVSLFSFFFPLSRESVDIFTEEVEDTDEDLTIFEGPDIEY